MKQEMTGAEIVLQSLVDQGVEVVFGYPGGAVLPIYDTLFKQNSDQGVGFMGLAALACDIAEANGIGIEI